MNEQQSRGSSEDLRPLDRMRAQLDAQPLALFRRFAEALPGLCWMATPQGEVFWANPQWHAYTGTTPEHSQARGWQSLFEPDELPIVLEEWANALASERPYERIFSLRGADGKFRPFLTRAAPIRNDSGAVIAWSGINTEVLELDSRRNRAETESRRLAEELDDFKELFAQAPSFMAMLRGADHRIVLTNAAYMQLIGHRDVLGKTVAEALPDAAQQGYVSLLDKVFRSGEPYSSARARYAVQVAPGEPVNQRFVDFIYQPVLGADGQVTGIFVEGHDVTERIEAEEMLRKTVGEKDRLAEHNELIAREMSHRIMNSFQLMEGMFRVQTGRISDPAAKAVVEQAGQRLHAMALVHRHLFRVTRDDITRLDVSDYLRELLGEIGPAFITENRCALSLHVEDDVHLSSGRGVALGLLVTELVINACKHAFQAGDNGNIAVSLVEEHGDRYKITVADNGSGLPPDYDSRPSGGLGMKLLTSFVRQLDGELTISGPPGTSFEITFPK
jgi:PAS domain S-box-containing protein